MSSYVFPSFGTEEIQANWIKFTAIDPAKDSSPVAEIMLYCPPGISIGDGANYSTSNLGLLGSDAANQLTEGARSIAENNSLSNDEKTAAASGFLSSFGKKLMGDIKNVGSEDVGYLLSRASPSQAIRDRASLESRRVSNPNTNTLFQNVNVRSFGFSFQMVAQSPEESTDIKGIVESFRKYLYPEINPSGLLLKFPVNWTIEFYHDGIGGTNGFYPKIHECFLTSFSSTINSNFSSHHADGAPYDVSCEVQFTEMKAYDRNTIL